MGIIIGLGTGRCGTASLAKLLSAQKNALCFHEMSPSTVRFFGTPRPFINTIDEFQAILQGGDPACVTVDLSRPATVRSYDALSRMREVHTIGDVAFYYLSYVELIARHNADVRFVCLQRDREETIESWLRKSTINRWASKRIADRLAAVIMRDHYRVSMNFWMEHDGSVWEREPVWDKCFPKFKATTKREAVAMYWDYYYEHARALVEKLGERFRIVHTEQLDDLSYQAELLAYCGVAPAEQVLGDAHIHRSARP